MNDTVPLKDSSNLPATWTKAPLDSLGAWFGGGTPSKDEAAYWNEGSIPWVSPKDMKRARILDTEDHITDEAVHSSATSLVPEGAVLMVTRSGILRHTFPVAVAGVKVTLNQDLKALVPFDGLDSEYIASALRAFGDDVLSRCSKHGTTVQSIEFSRFKDFQIPVAPLNEQERIVAKIDELFSELDAGVASLERARALLKKYRQAVLKAAVTGELTRDWREWHQGQIEESGADLLQRILKARRAAWEAAELNKLRAKGEPPKDDRWKQKYKEPQPPDTAGLPKLPERWVWASVEQLGFVESGQTPRGVEHETSPSGELPWFKVSSMAEGGNEIAMTKSQWRISKEAALKLGLRAQPQGTIVFPKRGGAILTNKKRRLGCEGAYDLNLMGVVPLDNVQAYLWIYFQGLDLKRIYDGSNVPQINYGDVAYLPVPLPPINEQMAVTLVLTSSSGR